MTDKPQGSKMAGRYGPRWWVGPLVVAGVVVLVLGVVVISKLGGKASPDDVKLAAAQGAHQAIADIAPTTTATTAAPQPDYYNYLSCDGMADSHPACNGPIIWPITVEAKQLITLDPRTGGLNMDNSRDLATQLARLPFVDQCQLSVGLDPAARNPQTGATYTRRVLYPDLSHTRLVDCGKGA